MPAVEQMTVKHETTGADQVLKGSTAGELLVKLSSWSFLNIAGAATTTVKSGAGIFHALVFNKNVASGVITIYDNTAASGTKIGTITNPAVLLQSLNPPSIYDAAFTTGLTIVTSAADDITVMYK